MTIRTLLRTSIAIPVLTTAMLIQSAAPAVAAWPQANPRPPRPVKVAPVRGAPADALYDSARALIEQNRYDRAVDVFDRVIGMRTGPTDAAMYWKAYSLSKMARGADALDTLGALQKQFPDSRWVKDARALDVEIRQNSGQPVAADAQGDEEIKLLALRGLMQSDPEKTVPILQAMLAGSNTDRVKERALFILSQSGSPRARDAIVAMAKGGANPELQLKAVRYLGMLGGSQGAQALDELYRSTPDPAVKRAIIRSYLVSGSRDRLLALAKSETAPELRAEAMQQLGAMGAVAELEELYRSESSIDVKKRIIGALFITGRSELLVTLAKTEADPEIRRLAIRNLGMSRRPETADVLSGIYASAGSDDIRRAVVEAFFLQSNAKALVALARTEKSVEMRRAIVEKLSVMRSPDATAYLMELLK